MPIEFTHCPGTVSSPDETEAQSFFFDPDAARQKLRAIEDAGFAHIIIDDFAGLLGNMDLAALAISDTHSLGIALTHWAGIVEPVVAARQIAFLDRRSGGRLSLRVLTGSASANESQNAEAHSHLAYHQKTDEYLVLLKRLWLNSEPIDHEGPFYSVKKGFVAQKAPRDAAIEFRMGGLSGTALRLAGRHASVFELAPGSRADVVSAIERVRSASTDYGRAGKIRFSLPIAIAPASLDNTASGARAIGISGTPTQIAAALLDYAELGVTEFAVHGLNSVQAIETFGRTIIPSLRYATVGRQSPEGVRPRMGQASLSRISTRGLA